jgi:uncharacterized protein (TIGR00255 family)
MTGFASKTFAIPLEKGSQGSLTISIKSLNSRYFETTFKLPHYLSSLETDITQVLKNQLKRGHIFFNINVSSVFLTKGTVEPSLDLVQGYLNAIEKIQKKFKIKGDISISEIIELPNIFATEEKNIDEQLKALIMSSTSKVADELMQARSKEGATLLQDLQQRCTVIEKEMRAIEKNSEKLMKQRKEEIGKELAALKLNSDSHDAQHMTLYNELNKIDIHEEIVRFKSHLENMQALFKSKDSEKGKRLDFTLQELAREINTIAAKGSDATIGSSAINIKVELEKIREQAQNIV